VARAVLSLGGHGLILRHPQRYDQGSVLFLERLLREPEAEAFYIAIEAPPSLLNHCRFRDLLRGAVVVKGDGPRRVPLDAEDPATRALALSPQGLPAEVLSALGFAQAQAVECGGPGGAPWVCLSPAARRHVLRRMPIEERRRLHARIFDAWEPKGWGYLRRAGHAIASGDLDRLLAQHSPYLFGIAGSDSNTSTNTSRRWPPASATRHGPRTRSSARPASRRARGATAGRPARYATSNRRSNAAQTP
jgi:hypothetical protein